MTSHRRRSAWIVDAFVIDGGIAWPVIAGYLALNALVLINALLHNPKIGYDASQHLKYATTLASGRLPTDADTHEFFSPPLPYLPTALLWALFDGGGRDRGAELTFKVAQLLQVGYSLVLTFMLVKVARLIRGGGALLPACALLCLGLIPAYYRTFAMIRGEPLLATLAMVGTYLTIRTFALRRPTLGAAALLGVTLGLAVLSRQWAFFLLPALGGVGLWRLVIDREHRGATLRAGAIAIATFLLVGGPFYLHLERTYGTIRAFNREPQSDDDRATPDEALPASDAARAMFTAPVRDVFSAHPFLLFYADIWGDYWQYYLVYATDRPEHYVRAGAVARTVRTGRARASNYTTMPAYLGRACAAGLVPSTLFAAGVVSGLVALRRIRRDGRTIILPTLSLCVLATLAGYAWFVISYPSDHGDTIKASYPLQLYGPLAIVGAAVVAHINARWPRVGQVIVGVLVVVALHNLPACVSRYR